MKKLRNISVLFFYCRLSNFKYRHSLQSRRCCRLNICLISVGVVQLFRIRGENEVKEQFVYLHIHIEPIKPRRSNNISLKMWMIITSHPKSEWVRREGKGAKERRARRWQQPRMCCWVTFARCWSSFLSFHEYERYGTFLIHPSLI